MVEKLGEMEVDANGNPVAAQSKGLADILDK